MNIFFLRSALSSESSSSPSYSAHPTPPLLRSSPKVVEGEQVPRMRREREGLQRREVQGSGLPIRQGGELRHVVSVCRVFLFVSNETYIIFEACCTIVGPRWLRIISRVRPARSIESFPLATCTRRYNSTEGVNWLIPMLQGERFAPLDRRMPGSSYGSIAPLLFSYADFSLLIRFKSMRA